MLKRENQAVFLAHAHRCHVMFRVWGDMGVKIWPAWAILHYITVTLHALYFACVNSLIRVVLCRVYSFSILMFKDWLSNMRLESFSQWRSLEYYTHLSLDQSAYVLDYIHSSAL